MLMLWAANKLNKVENLLFSLLCQLCSLDNLCARKIYRTINAWIKPIVKLAAKTTTAKKTALLIKLQVNGYRATDNNNDNKTHVCCLYLGGSCVCRIKG